MKKSILLIFLTALLFSCDPNRSPKFIDEKIFGEMRDQCKQKVGSSYSFDCRISLHSSPFTYVFRIVNSDGVYRKNYAYIKEENVENLSDEQISNILLARKEKLGDSYEESYEKVCIEDVNTIDDVFSLISIIYQRELNKYQQKQTSSYFVSKIEYDKNYFFPIYFHILTTKPRPMVVGNDPGIGIYIENFQQSDN